MPAMTLRTKLFGTVLLTGTMLLVGGLVGVFSLRQSSRDTEAMFQTTTRPLMRLEAMGRHLGAIRAEVLGHILESSPEAKAKLDASIRDRVAKIQEASRAYAAHDMEPNERVAVQEFDAAVAAYHAARESKVLPASRAGRREEAIAAATGEVKLIYQKARDILDRMVTATTSEGQVEADRAMERYATLRNWMLGLTLLGIALASAAGYWVARTITTKAEKVRALTADLASGDLTARIALADGEEGDELGQIGNALNVIMGTFQESLQEVQRATQSVSQAAAEIAAGNSDLSVRTEGQAANVEETASSMEEFGSTVEATASNAAKAATAAGEAARITREGRSAVGSLVGSMEEINQSARRINDIIGVVDEIAFQTNLLALNAAVEAARAGEQGRGFAVVASEVRSLAKRSADAAKEIKGLIREAVRKAQEGRETAARTDGIIQEVAENVQRTSDVISEIASATREQNSGIGEINRAVAQMDQGTQQNAAMVEQAAAAAESLNEQALTLGAVVARFRTGATSQGSVRQGSLDVQGAIHAHSRWLMRLKGFVEGFSEQDLDAAKVGRDDLCDLGKWIHGSGRNETDPALYAELKEQHAAFHVCAGGVIHVHRSRGKAAAEQLLLPESEFMQLSARVIRLLQQGLGRARQPRATETGRPPAPARPEAGRPAPSRKPAPALSRKPAPALRGELASSKPMVAPPADDGDWESF